MMTMKAAIIYEPGGPEVLKIESRPIPKPKRGEVLLRVKSIRVEPVGAIYPAGTFSECEVSPHPRDRSRGDC